MELNWEKVEKIRKIARDLPELSYAQIALMFEGVNKYNVRDVVKRRGWITKEERILLIQKQGKKIRSKSPRNYASVNNVSSEAKGSTTHSLLASKLEYYGWRCYYCGIEVKGRNLTFDHAIPPKRGGTNWTANLLPCCQRCNSSKGSRTVFEFIKLLGK